MNLYSKYLSYSSENSFLILTLEYGSSELAKHNISYKKLAELLNQRGWKLNKAAVDNRMCRGGFNADFFLDCLRVIGCENVGVIVEMPANDSDTALQNLQENKPGRYRLRYRQ